MRVVNTFRHLACMLGMYASMLSHPNILACMDMHAMLHASFEAATTLSPMRLLCCCLLLLPVSPSSMVCSARARVVA
jgi:hypothetical protein